MAILKNIKETLKLLPKGTFCIPLSNKKTPICKFKDFTPESVQKKLILKQSHMGLDASKLSALIAT